MYLAKNQGFILEDFFDKIGMTYGNFKGDNKNRPINSDAIVNILSLIPDLNTHWLLTGEGEMIKQTGNINISGNNSGINNTGVNQGTISINNSALDSSDTPNDVQLVIQSLQKTIQTLEKSLLSVEKINALQEKEISRLEKELLKIQM